jgi:hypothetical protein
MATVVKHGDDDYGSIWVKLNRLDGTATVYGPAPEPLGADADEVAERRFARQHKAVAIADLDADAQLASQRAFDADLWIVEVEDRQGRHGLEGLVDGA